MTGTSPASQAQAGVASTASGTPTSQSLDVPIPASLRELFATFLASYQTSHPHLVTVKMGRCKAFALALLEHHYPRTRGFVVQPTSLGDIANYGINFMLKDEDGDDPVFEPLKPKAIPKTRKGKKLTKKEVEQAIADEQRRQDVHERKWTASRQWHRILPENLAGFVVLARQPGSRTDAGAIYRPHTYLIILLDDLSTFKRIAATNEVHRSDLLVPLLTEEARISSGYGMLLYGTRFEVYELVTQDTAAAQQSSKGSNEEGHTTTECGKGRAVDEEGQKKNGTTSPGRADPAMKSIVAEFANGTWPLNIKLTDNPLDILDEVLQRQVVPIDVKYEPGTEGLADVVDGEEI